MEDTSSLSLDGYMPCRFKSYKGHYLYTIIKDKAGEKMVRDLDVVERQLETGMVKTTRNILNYVELLFSPNIKSQYYFNQEKNLVQHCVKDCDLGVEGYNCYINKRVLRDVIINLKTLYNQLEDDQEDIVKGDKCS